MSPIQIAGRWVGAGHPCFVIAEAGVNHNGDLDLARELVRVAVRSGADAVKFQTFSAEALATDDAPKAAYQQSGGAAAESQQQMLRRLELSHEAHHDLHRLCRAEGIIFLSSPFDEASGDFLQSLGVPAIKVPSGEITNLPFLRRLAAMGLPLILSTGMADLAEVGVAVATIAAGGPTPLALLHCVSNYPAEPSACNLRAMATMAEAFRVPVGFSDHTAGGEVALGAVALGASIVEKHFTLDQALPGPDHQASLNPGQLARLVRDIRTVESSLGDGIKTPQPSEAPTAAVARKSLVTAREIFPGMRIEATMVAARRPGTGISPAQLERVVGRVAKVPLPRGALIAWEDLH